MAAQNAPTPAQMYEEYLGPAIFLPWSRLLLEHARPRPGERVLDLACGTGIVARQVAPLVAPQGHVVGLDVNPDMLQVARATSDAADIEWHQGDATATGLADGQFDLLLCQQGFQFFPDKPAAAREMRRVLARSGRAVVAVWQGLDRHELFQAIFTAEARHLGEPVEAVAVPFSLPEPQRLGSLLEQAGFEPVEVLTQTQDVRFPSADRFLQLIILAGAAVIPAFQHADAAEREALIEAVTGEVAGTLERYRSADAITFPMTANTAIALAG
jgi:SAM-dependent methyltransferase